MKYDAAFHYKVQGFLSNDSSAVKKEEKDSKMEQWFDQDGCGKSPGCFSIYPEINVTALGVSCSVIPTLL